MKIVSKKDVIPEFWQWIGDKLPENLIPYTDTDGYSGEYGVTIRDKNSKKFLNLYRGNKVMVIRGSSVELRDPSWFSDIEDLIIKYETNFPGREITLEICEQGGL